MKQRIAASFGALALTATAALAVWHSPTIPKDSSPIPKVTSQPAPVVLGCSGAFVRSVNGGTNIGDVREDLKVRSWLFAQSQSGSTATAMIGDSTVSAQGLAWSATDGALSGILTTPAVANGSIELAGGTLHTATGGDLRGIAMNACGQPSMDQWLVGSSGALGVSNQLVLTNPGSTTVTAEVSGLGPAAPLELAGMSTVVLKPGQTKLVPIDAAFAEQERVALRVTTQAGGVVASLQSSALNGYTPAGVTYINPSLDSSTQVIPGVLVREGQTKLRIANPNQDSARVSVSVVTEEGTEVLAGADAVPVVGRSVLDLSLSGLKEKIVSLRLDSSLPVAASVEFASAADFAAPRDNAWAVARNDAQEGSAVFGPLDANAVFVADRPAKVTLTPISGEGKAMASISVDVDSGRQTAVPMPAGAVAVSYSADSPVFAAIITTADIADGRLLDWVPIGTSDARETSSRIAVQ